jgi:hypothetical protein
MHIILPYDKNKTVDKDRAYKKIMGLFKQYQQTEDKARLVDIQEIVNKIDSRFYIEFRVADKPRPYRIMFVPDRLKGLPTPE